MRYYGEVQIESGVVHTTLPFTLNIPSFPNADAVYILVNISGMTGSTQVSAWQLMPGYTLGGSVNNISLAVMWINYGVGSFLLPYKGVILDLQLVCNTHASVTSLTDYITARYWGQ